MKAIFKSVTAFAPATIANVSCGFDVLGLAVDSPGDRVSVTLGVKPGLRIAKITGDEGRLPIDPDKNTATVAVKGFLAHLGISVGLDFTIEKGLPLGSGMGSSAASAAAALVAVNHLLGSPLDRKALVPFALQAEAMACGAAHADNVAPALMGGLVLIKSYNPLDLITIPTPDLLFCTMVYPHIEVKTQDSRSLLKTHLTLADAITQWGNLGGLIAGFMKEDYDLIGRSLVDVVAEPIRSMLIPGFEQVKAAAMDAGVLGCGISGSGPTIFALSKGKPIVEKAGKAMSTIFDDLDLACSIYTSPVNSDGARVVHEE